MIFYHYFSFKYYYVSLLRYLFLMLFLLSMLSILTLSFEISRQMHNEYLILLHIVHFFTLQIIVQVFTAYICITRSFHGSKIQGKLLIFRVVPTLIFNTSLISTFVFKYVFVYIFLKFYFVLLFYSKPLY